MEPSVLKEVRQALDRKPTRDRLEVLDRELSRTHALILLKLQLGQPVVLDERWLDSYRQALMDELEAGK